MRVLIGLLMLWAAPAAAASCADTTFLDQSFTICTVGADDDVRLVGAGDGGGFGSLAAGSPKGLIFAMNAGMYHDDHRPVGLFRQGGVEIAPLVTREGPGNFGLLPNGVFCIGTDGTFAVVESRSFAQTQPDCPQATQSGPMLVIDGALHPRFIPGGTSKNIRNGVGVSMDSKTAFFAISNQPVNFYDFGRLFRDHLGVKQALFLDGNVSRLYAPDIGRDDIGFSVGPRVLVFDRAADGG